MWPAMLITVWRVQHTFKFLHIGVGVCVCACVYMGENEWKSVYRDDRPGGFLHNIFALNRVSRLARGNIFASFFLSHAHLHAHSEGLVLAYIYIHNTVQCIPSPRCRFALPVALLLPIALVCTARVTPLSTTDATILLSEGRWWCESRRRLGTKRCSILYFSSSIAPLY